MRGISPFSGGYGSRRPVPAGIPTGVQIGPDRSARAAQTVEAKAVKSLTKVFDSISFDDMRFAEALAKAPRSIQRRFVEAMYAYFRVIALYHAHGLWQDDEEEQYWANIRDIHHFLEP